jgi:hypothetical protein
MVHVDRTTGYFVLGSLVIIGARILVRRFQAVRAARREWARRGA